MEIRKHLHIVRRQKKVDWTQFLCGIPARDYIFLKELYEEQITQASAYLKEADHVLIGAGAGLSAAAGLTYSGKRFLENFSDFIKNTGCRICILPVFIHFRQRKSAGVTGADILM